MRGFLNVGRATWVSRTWRGADHESQAAWALTLAGSPAMRSTIQILRTDWLVCQLIMQSTIGKGDSPTRSGRFDQFINWPVIVTHPKRVQLSPPVLFVVRPTRGHQMTPVASIKLHCEALCHLKKAAAKLLSVLPVSYSVPPSTSPFSHGISFRTRVILG